MERIDNIDINETAKDNPIITLTVPTAPITTCNSTEDALKNDELVLSTDISLNRQFDEINLSNETEERENKAISLQNKIKLNPTAATFHLQGTDEMDFSGIPRIRSNSKARQLTPPTPPCSPTQDKEMIIGPLWRQHHTTAAATTTTTYNFTDMTASDLLSAKAETKTAEIESKYTNRIEKALISLSHALKNENQIQRAEEKERMAKLVYSMASVVNSDIPKNMSHIIQNQVQNVLLPATTDIFTHVLQNTFNNTLLPMLINTVKNTLQETTTTTYNEMIPHTDHNQEQKEGKEQKKEEEVMEKCMETIRTVFKKDVIPRLENAVKELLSQIHTSISTCIHEQRRTSYTEDTVMFQLLQQVKTQLDLHSKILLELKNTPNTAISSSISHPVKAPTVENSSSIIPVEQHPFSSYSACDNVETSSSLFPLTLSSNEDVLDPFVTVKNDINNALLRIETHEKGLTIMLSNNNIELLDWFCKKVEPAIFFTSINYFTNAATLLILIQQLTIYLRHNTHLGLIWLSYSLPKLNVIHPSIIDYTSSILHSLIDTLNVIKQNPLIQTLVQKIRQSTIDNLSHIQRSKLLFVPNRS